MQFQGDKSPANADSGAEPKFDAGMLAQTELPISTWYQPFSRNETEPHDNGEDALELEVSFRQWISHIPSTTYGAFGLYRYPAKFIPQVVAYAIQKYGACREEALSVCRSGDRSRAEYPYRSYFHRALYSLGMATRIHTD